MTSNALYSSRITIALYRRKKKQQWDIVSEITKSPRYLALISHVLFRKNKKEEATLTQIYIYFKI